MRRSIALAALAACLAASAPAFAEPETLSPVIQPLSFLIGHWKSGVGKAEKGMVDKGEFTVEPAAGGAALIRRDHTELYAADGKAITTIDQVMLIYPEKGDLRGDYFDGSHAIHYTSAVVVPDKSVTFVTDVAPGSPSFRLTYNAVAADRVGVKFEMAPPGSTTFIPIATGEAKRE